MIRNPINIHDIMVFSVEDSLRIRLALSIRALSPQHVNGGQRPKKAFHICLSLRWLYCSDSFIFSHKSTTKPHHKNITKSRALALCFFFFFFYSVYYMSGIQRRKGLETFAERRLQLRILEYLGTYFVWNIDWGLIYDLATILRLFWAIRT